MFCFLFTGVNQKKKERKKRRGGLGKKNGQHIVFALFFNLIVLMLRPSVSWRVRADTVCRDLYLWPPVFSSSCLLSWGSQFLGPRRNWRQFARHSAPGRQLKIKHGQHYYYTSFQILFIILTVFDTLHTQKIKTRKETHIASSHCITFHLSKMVKFFMPKLTNRQWATALVIAFADFCSAVCISLQAPFYPAEVR